MLRALARFLGIWMLAAALALTVIDGAKSLAAAEVVVTDMASAAAMVEQVLPGRGAPASAPAPAGNEAAGTTTTGPAEFLRLAPAAPLLALFGVILLIVGRRRRRHPLGREFMA